MAEAVVSMVIEGLKPLGNFMIQQANFLTEVNHQVELAQRELLLMRSFLKDADARQEDDEVVRSWVNEVREAAYDLEDVIEAFVLKVAIRRGGSMMIVLKRFACIWNEGVHRYKIGSEIESITTKLSKLRLTMQSYDIKQTKGSEGANSFASQQERTLTYSHVSDDHDVVGLGDDIEKLATRLVEEGGCRIVSIWGMGGLGKTTPAKKVYGHKKVQCHFDCFAWRLCDFQREKKCLVVLDDIWTVEVWDSLKGGFPAHDQETNSRIILTTRNQELASIAKENAYQSHALSEDDAWNLFRKIAFSQMDETDSQIKSKKELGEKMLRHCAGLPLAIIVLAGLLSKKDTVNAWETVCENVNVYIRRGTDLDREYKGQKYGDYEIPVKLLTHLWMAEGFISETSSEILEDVSYSCLSELVQRCIVQVGQIGSTGKIKSCHLHDLMRDLCMLKAKEENFSHVVNFSTGTRTNATQVGRVRRLAIYVDRYYDNLVPTTRDGHLRCVQEDGTIEAFISTPVAHSRREAVIGKLNIQGLSKYLEQLEEILKSRSGPTFHHLRSLSLDMDGHNCDILSRFRLICKLQVRGGIVKLPEELLSFPNLIKIKLASTKLKEEDQTEILEKLPHLRVLYLQGHVFSSLPSDTLVCTNGGFPNLEFLYLEGLPELKEWRLEKGAMPRLRRLCIDHCTELKAVPDGLQYIKTLKELTVTWMPSEFCSTLGKEGEDFEGDVCCVRSASSTAAVC
uniref:probable disease resistance RPP8-like protein 2 n=1 Tax=Fragaria vesca subsp. vesca TaxID=101020 RepID=UPI0005CABF3A|nr:PREDICTED: probable disease resistance RPP8-like protein 2 [Fragaria vesca subsp. vesca]